MTKYSLELSVWDSPIFSSLKLWNTGPSGCRLWCLLHKIMMCSIFVSVTKQPTVQNELREPGRNIYDLCESSSGGPGFLNDYSSLILWFSKQYKDTDLCDIHSRKKISRMFCNFYIALSLGTIEWIKKYMSAPALKELTLCRPNCDLVVGRD